MNVNDSNVVKGQYSSNGIINKLKSSIVLDVDRLSVQFCSDSVEKQILKDISFSVAKGQCLGILGESGSGKSMTTKALVGSLNQHFHINGRIDLLGRTIEILESMKIKNCEEVLEKYPHQLSGGMLQRVMIGLALAMEPDLIIADEPTTAIDSITQYEIIKAFQAIKARKQQGMIFISHDVGVISHLADTILVLNKGRVADYGPAQGVINNPQDEYTKLLIEKKRAVFSRYTRILQGKVDCCDSSK